MVLSTTGGILLRRARRRVARPAAALPALVKTRLRELRAARSWSQADLAERLGVSRQTINAIETGRSEPSLSLAFRIAALFGATIEGVFQPTD